MSLKSSGIIVYFQLQFPHRYNFNTHKTPVSFINSIDYFHRDVKRGVPGERLRQFMEGKVSDPSNTAKPIVFQEDPLTFLRDGRLETSVDVIIFNEEVVSN